MRGHVTDDHAQSAAKAINADVRDEEMIAQYLAHVRYQSVHVLSGYDRDTKRYLRMRYDHKLDLKRKKQQINSFCMLEGCKYAGQTGQRYTWKGCRNWGSMRQTGKPWTSISDVQLSV